MKMVDDELRGHGVNPEGVALSDVVGVFGYDNKDFNGTHIQPQDLIHIAAVGAISGLSAHFLKDVLTRFHDGPLPGDPEIYKKIAKMLDHSNNPIDGSGFDAARMHGVNPIRWHRMLHGHDVLNFEGWSAYIHQDGNTLLGSLRYLKHMVADTFSAQGLPVPGSSYVREAILRNFTADEIPKYLTLKARDVAADALSGLYSVVTQNEPPGGKRDYRKYEVAIANRISSLIGILVTTGCVNPVDVFLISVHSARLLLFELNATQEAHRLVGELYDDVQALCREPILDYDDEYQSAIGRTYSRRALFFDPKNAG